MSVEDFNLLLNVEKALGFTTATNLEKFSKLLSVNESQSITTNEYFVCSEFNIFCFQDPCLFNMLPKVQYAILVFGNSLTISSILFKKF